MVGTRQPPLVLVAYIVAHANGLILIHNLCMYIERCILAFPLFILSSLHKPPTSKMLQIYRSLLASIVVLTLYHHAKSIAAEDDCCKGCNAYSCMERVAHCGNDGYLIAFGLKNCKHFNTKEVYEKFDENGQRFINCTGKCLIDFMDRYIQDHESAINCNLLKNVGFHSHANCYLACDFCKICKSNKLALLAAYDYRDFFSMEAIRQVFAVIKKCGLFNCFAMNL